MVDESVTGSVNLLERRCAYAAAIARRLIRISSFAPPASTALRSIVSKRLDSVYRAGRV